MITLLVLSLLGDFFWWRWADRRLRRFANAWLWRGLLATFMSVQAGYALCYLVDSSWTRSARNMVPLPLHVSAYLWHLMVLPTTGLLIWAWTIVGLGAAGIGILRLRPA